MSEDFQKKVREVIDEQIKPFLHADGGDIEIVKFDGNNVVVKLQGACAGCAGARYTLKMGVEARLKDAIPEFGEVIAEGF